MPPQRPKASLHALQTQTGWHWVSKSVPRSKAVEREGGPRVFGLALALGAAVRASPGQVEADLDEGLGGYTYMYYRKTLPASLGG